MERLDGALLDDVSSRASRLPARLRRALAEFAARPGPTGALLVRGLPVDGELPETPRDGRPSPDKATRLSECALILAASCVGTVIGYREEKEGNVVHDVCPVPGREERQENSGSQYFEVHTENAFHPFRPDHVLLLCLRADADGAARTLVGPARAATAKLSHRDREMLRGTWFRHRMPSSFSVGDAPAYSAPQPVLNGPPEDPWICVDAFNTIGTTQQAQDVLERLGAALKESLTGSALAPGELLVVDNRRAVHARTGFTPRYDGFDRWLQRVFTVRDFERSRGARASGSHVCALSAGVAAG